MSVPALDIAIKGGDSHYPDRRLLKKRATSDGEQEKASKAKTEGSSSSKKKWIGPLVACIIAALVFAGATAYGLSEKKKGDKKDDVDNERGEEAASEVKDPKTDSAVENEEEEVDADLEV